MSDLPNPVSRTEDYLANIAGEAVELPDYPVSRIEEYLAKIAGEDVEVPEYPVSRIEEYLAYIAEHGGVGGGGIDIEWDGSTDGHAQAEIQSNASGDWRTVAYLYKVSDYIDKETITNSIAKMSDGFEGAVGSDYFFDLANDKGYIVENLFCGASEAGAHPLGMNPIVRLSAPEPGVYFWLGAAYLVKLTKGVTASPLSVTANGPYTADVGKAYNPVTVNVPVPDIVDLYAGDTEPVGAQDGDLWVDYSGDVSPQGAPVEVSTSAGMEAVLVADNVGKAYKFTGTTDETYTNGDIYVVEEGA